MADDKQGRDKQAHDEERRQRERELEEERERSDEAEPVDPDEGLEELLASHDYPAAAVELLDAFGNRQILTRSDSYTLEELLGSVEEDHFESAGEAQATLRETLERTD